MNSRQKNWLLTAATAGAGYLLLRAWLLEKYFFSIKRFRIGPHTGGPVIRILLLADLHLKSAIDITHQRLLRRLHTLNPDLILVSGDIIDEHGEAAPGHLFFDQLPRIPLLVIPGNHDNKNGVSRGRLKRMIERVGGRLLANETASLRIKDTVLTVTGVDDCIEGEANLRGALEGVGTEQHHLALIHSPLQAEKARETIEAINAERREDERIRIQYIFSGHNHGGQVRFGPVVPVLPEYSGDYINGWYFDLPPFLYVSKGFGTSQLPFRFGARSEITLLEYGV